MTVGSIFSLALIFLFPYVSIFPSISLSLSLPVSLILSLAHFPFFSHFFFHYPKYNILSHNLSLYFLTELRKGRNFCFHFLSLFVSLSSWVWLAVYLHSHLPSLFFLLILSHRPLFLNTRWIKSTEPIKCFWTAMTAFKEFGI